MPTIHINVKNRVATANGDSRIINGNSDYNIEFDFDAEWADLNNKIGIFAYNDAAAHKWAYQTVMFSGNTCTVPILRDIHCVYVGVTAGNVRVTTPAKVQCRLSISDYADTEEPPSADVWGQILAKLDELQTEIDEIKAGGVGGTDISLNVTGATAGQTIKVKAVDADGKPTAWEAVDMAGRDTWELLGTLDASSAEVLQLDFHYPVKKLYFSSVLTDSAGEAYSASDKVYRQVAFNVDGTWRDVNGFKIGCCKHTWGWETRYWLECGADLPIAKGEWASALAGGSAALQLTPFHASIGSNYTKSPISGIRFSLNLSAAAENTASGSIEVWGVKA